MKKTSIPRNAPHLGGLCLVALLPLAPATAVAELAQKPLFLLNAGAPNIFFLHDDSGSMSNLTLTPDNNPPFVPSHEKNPLYYNPNAKYLPWPGLKSNGQPRYVDMTLTAALKDPNDSSSGVNLTGSCTEVAYVCTELEKSPCKGWFYEYKNGAGAIQTQCVSTLTDTAAKTNFANWYSYHRNRSNAAKFAMGSVINNSTGKRLGYGTINNTVRTADKVIPVASNNKEAVLTELYATTNNSGTPLQRSLDWAGKYYENKISGKPSPILSEQEGGACQLNNTILMTDGYYNNGGNDLAEFTGIGNTDKDKSATQIDGFDGQPYSDTHSNTLADIAMHYYERDLSPLPNTAKGNDKATHQRMNTHTVAFGLEGNIPNPNSLDFSTLTTYDWGVDPTGSDKKAKIDDLFHASVNGRGRYFSAGNPDALIRALDEIVSGVGNSGSSANTIATSAFRLKENDLAIISSFNPADWSGELKALKVTATGTLDTTTSAWSSNTTLKFNDARNIITYNDVTNTGVSFNWDNLTTAQKASLSVTGDIADYDQYRLAYLRGQDRVNLDGSAISLDVFRKRSAVLGDIINSSPVYVGEPSLFYPDAAPYGEKGNRYTKFWYNNKGRTPVIYVGANDGMLHGFNANTGAELLAYVPNAIFPKLKEITHPSFNASHKYFVDQTPTISDVYTSGAWKSVLVSGLGAGGRGLFALNITDPKNFTEAKAANIALWEFTNANDADLGHTLAKPVIGLDENNKWVAITGNGFGAESGDAALFILDIDSNGTWAKGTNYKKIDTENQTDNGLFSPAAVDSDGNGKIDRVYAGDLLGNMWVFDLTKLPYSSRKLFTARDENGKPQPITSKPTVIRHPTEPTAGNKPNMLVLFGTGRYLEQSDLTNSDDQSFYAVWDNGGTTALTRSDLENQTVYSGKDSALNIDARVTENDDVTYSAATTAGKKHGWYIELDSKGTAPSERVITSANVYRGIVFFTTYAPSNNPCDGGGESWFMTMKVENGGPPDKPIISINNNRTVETTDVVTVTGGGINTPPSGLKIDGSFGVRLTDSSFILNMSNNNTPNNIGNIAHNLGAPINPNARTSWRELRRE